MTTDYTATYLPSANHGAVLHALADQGLTGSIRPVEDVMVLDTFPQGLFGQFAQATGWAITATKKVLAVELPIYYCFVKSDASNAFALNFGKWACITLSDELLLETWYLIGELSRSEFLAEYRNDLPQVYFSSDHPTDRAKLVRKIIEVKQLLGLAPKLTKTLSSVGVLFIAHHELGHIANGHLGAELVGAALGETETSSNLEELTTLRTLEYDADAMATQLTLEYCFRLIGDAGDSTEYFKDEFSAIHTVFAAIYLVMCVLEAAQETSIPDYQSRSHPPAIFRYFATFSAASNVLTKIIKSPRGFSGRIGKVLSMEQQDAQARAVRAVELAMMMEQQAIIDAQARAVRAVELAMTDRVGLSADPDLIRQAIERSQEHDAEIYKRWTEIRPKLEKAKLGNHKLAPAQFGPDGKRLRPGPYDWSSE